MCKVNVENYNALNGLMVECPDKATACTIAEQKAQNMNKDLQNTTPMALLRDNEQCWFFPFEVEDEK